MFFFLIGLESKEIKKESLEKEDIKMWDQEIEIEA